MTGSLVITLVCGTSVSESVRQSLNISETAHKFFMKLCMKLGAMNLKRDKAGILKENLNSRIKGIKVQKLRFLTFSWKPIIEIF